MKADWSQVDWFIGCVGMSDATMWSFEADSQWLMVHGTPGAALGAFPSVERAPQASLADVLFLANCLAFDHDLPIVVTPARDHAAARRPLVEPIVYEPGPQPGRWYWEHFTSAMAMAAEIRLGGGSVWLRYDEGFEQLTRFSERFGDRLEALGLYAAAARQVDPTSEFLGHWRVLEWADRRNGVDFVAANLDKLASFDFGECHVREDIKRGNVNMFEAYRARALKRVEQMHDEGRGIQDMAKDLYAVRNALAHGRTRTLVNDFGASIEAVGADLPVVKLLSRIAVEAHSTPSSKAT